MRACTTRPNTANHGAISPVSPVRRRAAAKALASLGLAVAVFAGISVASGLGFGWINAINVPGMAETISPFTLLGHALQYPATHFGWDPSGRAVVTVVRAIGAVDSPAPRLPANQLRRLLQHWPSDRGITWEVLLLVGQRQP